MANLTVFDIFAGFAHFKRPYTTTSPVSFPIPSKPTLYGMMGAVIGLDKDHYLEHFYNREVRVGIKIINPLNKIYIAENLINTKEGFARFKTHTQIKIEFLKNVAYRIYVSHPDKEIANTLLQNLREHKSHYTFSMGLSECIGNFKFVGNFDSITRGGSPQNAYDYVDIHSVIPSDGLVENDVSVIKFGPGKEIFRISLTAEMNTEREIQRMTDIIFERNGGVIPAKVKGYDEIVELKENIILF
jgi:CRISPR-associated protein Cas5h